MQAVELSPHCSSPACDGVTDVIGQIDVPYKCFYKLRHRHRDVCCHLLPCFHFKLRGSGSQCCLFAVNSFHLALEFC